MANAVFTSGYRVATEWLPCGYRVATVWLPCGGYSVANVWLLCHYTTLHYVELLDRSTSGKSRLHQVAIDRVGNIVFELIQVPL